MAEISSVGDSMCNIEKSPILIGSKITDAFSQKIFPC
jgi:hypothetical protein